MTTQNDEIIRAQQLVKRFGKLTAVDGLSLSIRRGEIYGFLGPNGAGKTTTIRMLTTMELPDDGDIFIDGNNTKSQFIKARRLIGVIQQQNSLDKDLTVKENIIHHALMQNLSFSESKKRMATLSELMELNGRLDDKVEELSGGWRRRVAIVCSLIHEPKILFMDEPTTGLDTQSRNKMWKLIRNINRNGTTIFLTTHYIFEAESLCDRIGIINNGKLISEGTPAELKDMVGNFAVVSIDDNEDETVMYHPDLESAKRASMELHNEGGITIRRVNLEDVFLELTGRKL